VKRILGLGLALFLVGAAPGLAQTTSDTGLAGKSKAVALTADNQAVTATGVGVILLTSDDATATARTFTLTASTLVGHTVTLVWDDTDAGELADSGTQKLNGIWTPLARYAILVLVSDGTNWIETSRKNATGLDDLTLADAHVLVGNASNLAADVAVTGDVTISNTGVTAIGAQKVISTMISATDGAVRLTKVASVGFAALNAATTGVGVVFGAFIPDNAIITSVWYDVTTTFVDNGSAGNVDTATLQIGLEDQDDDVVAATTIAAGGNIWDIGVRSTIVTGLTTTKLKLTAQRKIKVEWTAGSGDSSALTAGAMDVYVEWVQGS